MEDSNEPTLFKQLNEHLRLLIAWQQSYYENSQRSISYQVHNELGQEVTGLKMDIAWLKRKIGTNTDPLQVHEKLNGMNELLDKMVASLRRIEQELYPSILDNLGIEAALEWQSHETQKKHGIEIAFHPSTNGIKPSYPVANGLFRIYKEALTTISENAEARHIESILELKNNFLHLVITDDGKPVFSSSNGVMNRIELLAIKERASMIHGELNIGCDQLKHNQISVSIPSSYLS